MGDFHMCPMVTPGTPPIPHVGGAIMVGMPTVLIGNMPAATLGSMCTCVGPPDTIILGSMGVLIGNKPAARMGDMCAHGGMIAVGFPTVIIGEMSPGGPSPVAVAVMVATAMIQAVQIDLLKGGQDTVNQSRVNAVVLHTAVMTQAAATGAAFVHDCAGCSTCSPKQ